MKLQITLTSDLIKLLEQSLKENGDLPISVIPMYKGILKMPFVIKEEYMRNYAIHNPTMSLDIEYDYAHKSDPYRGAPEKLTLIIE